MQDHTLLLQRRLAGMTLLVSFLLFWGGAAFSIPLVDTQGSSIYVLPPQQVLPVIAAHPQFWQWQTLFQLAGGVVAAAGLVLLTLILRATRDRNLSLLALVTFCFSVVSWIVIEAFRLGAGVWATQNPTQTAPAFYELLYLWMDGALFAISVVLAFCALVAYGGALLMTTVLPRWVGWIILLYACATLGLFLIIGPAFVPPELVYLPLGLLGVVLLLRRPQPVTQHDSSDVVTREAAGSH